MRLNDLKPNYPAVITKIKANQDIKNRFLDIGMVRGSIIEKLLENKNMSIYSIKGSTIAIRKKDTINIEVI